MTNPDSVLPARDRPVHLCTDVRPCVQYDGAGVLKGEAQQVLSQRLSDLDQ